MCGIVAVVRTPSDAAGPVVSELLDATRLAAGALQDPPVDVVGLTRALDDAGTALGDVDSRLRGGPGLRSLVGDPAGAGGLDDAAAATERRLDEVEARLDAAAASSGTDGVESANAALVRVRDACWAIRRDRIATAAAVRELVGDDPGPAAVEAYAAIQVALAALDRLEVRGRDSAGIHVLVTGHGLDLDDHTELAARAANVLFTSGAARTPGGHLSLVYKAASEIGRLGDNGRALRAAIAGDTLLRAAVRADGARVTVLAHTRWASVGMINQANAHPLTSEEDTSAPQAANPYVVAALNGDVDNHAELSARHDLRIPPAITTDAKVIPVLTARRLAAGAPLDEAFRQTVAQFDGSVAIAAEAVEQPGRLLLALRGSGQALYVGLSDDQFVVASEPYGLVEQCSSYLRMDGESGSRAGSAGRGQVVVLDHDRAGTLAGIRRLSYDGAELPVHPGEVRAAEITTRDIDLRGYPHFLRKEIEEAPTSLRKTLRGRIVDRDGRPAVALGAGTIPADLSARLAAGEVDRVVVIGQGTAAVAGAAVAAAIRDALAPVAMPVDVVPATELSGFGLSADMTGTLAVAISQSGTTTDTNRTVDLLHARGATVLAIVNRRGSDLVDKADGVLYTADGRDVEMSVASTKAFYAQVAAGQLLALALADAAGCTDPDRTADLLTGLRDLPAAMQQVIAEDSGIAELAADYAPHRRSWAIVGNGRNRIAAEEIRIKLSELCYKAVACDATEDKKHIDLSSEPLTVVCAAGLVGSAADDVAKEVAIFRAHNSVPLVIATAGEARFDGAAGVIAVPPAHPALAFVLSAVAGHLFGYHAALAIDAQALPLRQARAAIELAAEQTGGDAEVLLSRLEPALAPPAADFGARLRAGSYNGTLEAATAARLALAFHSAAAPSGEAGPAAVLDELTAALTAGIDELTRPVDAIKHQAKTVTVGISRSDEAVLTVPLVAELLEAGADRAALPYATLKAVADLDPVIGAVAGHTRYRIEGAADGPATKVVVTDKGGIAADLPSRTAADPRLRGTKQLVAAERKVLAAVGRHDGRTVLLVPETAGTTTTGITLLHVRFRDRVPAAQMRSVLDGYRGRLTRLRTAVTETEPTFDEAILGDLPPLRLLTDEIDALAAHWRAEG